MDIARIGFEAETASLKLGEQSMDSFAAKGEQVERRITVMADNINAALLRPVQAASAATTQWVTNLRAHATAFDNLRASVDPLFAASRKYEAAQQQVNAAVKAGIVSQREAERVLEAAAQQYLVAGDAMQTYGMRARGFTFQTANLMAQFNDVGVMLASGQNPFILAMQQGTQINQVLAQMGDRQKVLRGLAQAFMGMINPVSLATIGIIAGGAALAQWGISALSAKEDTDAFTEALGEVSEKIASARHALRADLRGVDTDQLLLLDAIAEKEAEIARQRERAASAAQNVSGHAKLLLPDLIAERDELSAQLNALRQIEQTRERLLTRTEQTADAERLVGEQLHEAMQARKEASKEAVKELKALQEQAALTAVIARFGEDSAAAAQLRAAQERAAFIELTNSRNVSEDLKSEMIASYDAANMFAGVDMASVVGTAANEAERLAENLKRAIELAPITPAQMDEDTLFSQQVLSTSQTRQNQAQAVDNFNDFLNPNKRGGGKSDAEKERDKMLRERDRILDGLKTAQDRYNESVEQADRLLKAKVLTQDQYSSHLEQLKLELDEVKFEDLISGIDSISEAFGTAIDNGESLRDAFSSVLRRMVADLVTSGIREALISAFAIGQGGNAAGGFFDNLFAGFFDQGGSIPAGQFGIAGERGPEIVTGPASVTSRADTARLLQGNTERVRVDVGVYVEDDGKIGAIARSHAQDVAVQVVRGGIQQNNYQISQMDKRK